MRRRAFAAAAASLALAMSVGGGIALAEEINSDAAQLADDIEATADAEVNSAVVAQSLSDAVPYSAVDESTLPAEAVNAPQSGTGRSVQTIDSDWWFDAGADTSAAGWNFPDGGESGLVTLPHNCSYTHPTMSFIPTMSRKTVSYTKKLDISQVENCCVNIKFEAADKILSLYVKGGAVDENGNASDLLVGEHTGGYSAFDFDLTDAIKSAVAAGKTTITLEAKVTNIDIDSTPINVDWIQYMGIYRDVELIVTPSQYISTENSGSNGIFVDYKVDGANAALSTRVDITNQDAEAKELKIESSILDAAGNVVSTVTQDVKAAASQSNQEFTVSQTIEGVHLWNGTADPYLYTTQVKLYDATGNLLDVQTDNFGVRTFEVKDGKAYLNGEVLEVHGVGYHQDREGKGFAVTSDEIEQDVETMLEMGVNAVRASHYQHDDYFYELCDQKGIIVYAEIPFYLIYSKAESFQASVKSQMTELIRQDYNNPSIVMWGIQNELRNLDSFKQYGSDFDVTDDEVIAFVESLVDLVRSEDSSRMCAQALINKKSEASSLMSKWSGDIDLTGLNLYCADLYTDEGRKSLTRQLNKAVDSYKEILGVDQMMLTEYGIGGTIGQHTELGDDVYNGGTAYQPEECEAFVHEVYWKFIQSRDDIPLTFAWNMFDFSCYRNEGGLSGINTKGMLCFDHTTKKDVFYYYKAVWNEDDRFVHLTSKRYTERKKSLQQIKAYSNCDRVELYLNGESCGWGTKTQDGVFVWDDIDIGEADSNSLKVVAYNVDDFGHYVYVDEDGVDGVKRVGQTMHRLYNPYTGEHFYTSDADEVENCVAAGWNNEGVGWTAPLGSYAGATPVYRLYNSYVEGGDHMFTASEDEKESLIAAGWTYEGIGWYSAPADGSTYVEVLRAYNPYAATGTHHYTTNEAEIDTLTDAGWNAEGVAWYGLK
ncbi:glycoside hydrolase family 2 TIM barrel-domain containing protein [Paratractidigestivibacter sp.]|uniref:glycoside hydrolase family 2 TIM barrel-domain containing protein n=1 Tax=Paratractidigestivibacter sp. TaxID=2847316 RepID=UPI002ABE6109|nr:glycoside hydrolase family 2 TIM barrel-domain containing protein [Paratractidigestivibacter sp.]